MILAFVLNVDNVVGGHYNMYGLWMSLLLPVQFCAFNLLAPLAAHDVYLMINDRQFLMGLQKYGKGDWRNISRNFVTTRTPTQVASHAQKYFIRQLTGGKDKRRSSIHDITTINIPNTPSSSPDHGKPLSPNNSSAVIQSQQQPKVAGVTTKELFDFEWKQQNEEAAMVFNQTSSGNAFLSPFCEISSYGAKLEEQNLLRETLPRSQFGSYNTLFQMQSMQRQ